MRYKKFLLIATNRVKISHFVIGEKKNYEHVDDEKYCCACKIKKKKKHYTEFTSRILVQL